MNSTNHKNDTPSMDTIIRQTKEKFNQILDFALSSNSKGLYDFEKTLLKLILELGRFFLQIFLLSFGNGDEGKKVLTEDGAVLNRYRQRGIDYMSIFGEVDITRWYYWQKGREGICPLDERLNLPERMYSYFLQELIVSFDVNETYEKSLKKLKDLFGLQLSPRSVMDILQDVSKDAEDFRNEQVAPPVEGEKDILAVSVDGKGVPMRKEHLSEKKVRLGRGEKNQKKKMSAVSAVYSTDKRVRSTDDILGDGEKKSSRGDKSPGANASRPYEKKIRARLGDKADKEDFIKRVREEADKRDAEGGREKVFLGDGERFLWGMKDKYFREYIGILDFYHVTEKAWDFAYCFHPEGSPEARGCAVNCLRMLLDGNVEGCIIFMETAGKKDGLGVPARASIGKISEYFRRNREHMRYDRYISQGLPIGSGNVESACKNLIKDRMEGSGMRWSKKGADAMLALRAIDLNGDLEEYFGHHMEKERERLYGKTSRWRRIGLCNEPYQQNFQMAA